MSPDTTTAPVIAPEQAPVDVPVESPSRPVTDDGDHDRFAHYARKDDVARAYVTGEAIVELCGKKWIPTRDPKNQPDCRRGRGRKAGGGKLKPRRRWCVSGPIGSRGARTQRRGGS